MWISKIYYIQIQSKPPFEYIFHKWKASLRFLIATIYVEIRDILNSLPYFYRLNYEVFKELYNCWPTLFDQSNATSYHDLCERNWIQVLNFTNILNLITINFDAIHLAIGHSLEFQFLKLMWMDPEFRGIDFKFQ